MRALREATKANLSIPAKHPKGRSPTGDRGGGPPFASPHHLYLPEAGLTRTSWISWSMDSRVAIRIGRDHPFFGSFLQVLLGRLLGEGAAGCLRSSGGCGVGGPRRGLNVALGVSARLLSWPVLPQPPRLPPLFTILAFQLPRSRYRRGLPLRCLGTLGCQHAGRDGLRRGPRDRWIGGATQGKDG